MITNIEKKLKFIELVDEMKDIKRSIFLRNGERENDAEHSYHLALMVMTFIDDFPELDYEKCIKIALIHDIIEIYAGDTRVLDKDAENTKESREMDAFLKLKEEFFEVIPEIINLLEEYEKKESKEAQFVYSLDKVQPTIQTFMEGGNAWREFNLDFDELMQRNYSKIFPGFGIEKILDIYMKKSIEAKITYKKTIIGI